MKFMIKLVMIGLMALDWLVSLGTGLTVARIDPKFVGGNAMIIMRFCFKKSY